MLKTQLLHPEILRICAECGHHAKILIADGNYPASSKKGPNAKVVSLQLTPGIPTVSQVLKVLLASIPIDQLFVMGIDPSDRYAQKEDPVVWTEYREIVRHHDSSKGGTLSQIESIMKWDFYAAVQSEDHVLTVQTADQALWANVLLSVGVRTKD